MMAALASEEGLSFRTGPFVCRVRSRLERLAVTLHLLYADFPREAPDAFADFNTEVRLRGGLRRWFRPQARFLFEARDPFLPLPADQAFPLLEWGLNWCVSSHCHGHLLLHSAVVERHGGALLMPAPPGSGKSTLTAALTLHGWRLLSDELGLVQRSDARLTPLARPVSLKNHSLPAVRAFAPEAVLGEPVHDTTKGTVAHLKPPAASVARMQEPAPARWIVLPRYRAGATARIEAVDPAEAFMELAGNSFNYDLLGQEGFRLLGRLVDDCRCYRFEFDRLDQAVERLERTLDADAQD